MGLVRLFSVAIAAVSMDKAGRKILLFVSGVCLCLRLCKGTFSLRISSSFVNVQEWRLPPCRTVEGCFPFREGSAPEHHIQGRHTDCSPFHPSALLHLSTAGVMLASNLTMGLYIHLVPSSQNSTIANRTLGSLASPPAEPTNYITLIPLLAAMFFIMGRCREQKPGAGYEPGGVFFSLGDDKEQGGLCLGLEGTQTSLAG